MLYGRQVMVDHAAVAAGFPPSLAARQRLAPSVVEFSTAAGRDALVRAAGHWTAPGTWLDLPDYPEAVVQWARGHELSRVVMHWPTVGPWQALSREIADALASAGVPVAWFRRGWDDGLYPLARAGFFGFWKKAAQRLPSWQVPAASS